MATEKKPKQRVLTLGNISTFVGLIASLAAIIGVLIGLNVIRPFSPTVAPTATPNLQAFSDPHIHCRPDNTIDPKTPWLSDGTQTTTYGCNAIGMIITQAPHATTVASADLPIPLPHEPLTRNYSISVQISNLAAPQTCAGVGFRHSGYRAYVVGICLNGMWVFTKSFATNGTLDILNHGTYTVQQGNSYSLLVEVSNETATISIDHQLLPVITLDPTFQDNDIDLVVGDAEQLFTGTYDPNANPGTSATFSQFVFQPLP